MTRPCVRVRLCRYYMQVYAKCNQNCVKIAGNPRDSRRFRVSIDVTRCMYYYYYMTLRLLFIAPPCLEALITTLSPYRTLCLYTTTPSIVLKCAPLQPNHPSYYGWTKTRKVKKNNTIIRLIFILMVDLKPRIIAVFPSEGWTGGGRDICIIGESFSNEMQLIFGAQQVPCKVNSLYLRDVCMYLCYQQIISSSALSVTVPRRSVPGEVFITVFANGEHHCTDSPGIYNYLGKRTIYKP